MVLTDEWDEPLLLIPLLPLLPSAGGVVRAGPYLVKRKLFANYSSKCYVSTDGFFDQGCIHSTILLLLLYSV